MHHLQHYKCDLLPVTLTTIEILLLRASHYLHMQCIIYVHKSTYLKAVHAHKQEGLDFLNHIYTRIVIIKHKSYYLHRT